jgi:Protein of unknown function (DUF1295)
MIAQMLITNFAVLMAAILLLWAACVQMRDVSVIDSFWAFGMVMMAGLSFVQTEGSPPRKVLLFGLCGLWGLRLAAHLFIRWRGHGEDKRYKAILGRATEKKGWSFARASLQMVFLLQAPLLFFVCLPVQLGQVAAEPAALGWQAVLGTLIAPPASCLRVSVTGSLPGSRPIPRPRARCSIPVCGAIPVTPIISATPAPGGACGSSRRRPGRGSGRSCRRCS